MDLYSARKRKSSNIDANNSRSAAKLTLSDAINLLSVLTGDDLRSLVASSILHCPITLALVRRIANNDLTKRKLFIRGLSWGTTEESLRSSFSQFGELEEVTVVFDKITGKSKGHGFVTFKNVDGALLALKQPKKKIDGRWTAAQLASTRNKGAVNKTDGGAVNKMDKGAVNKMDRVDVGKRKIYVGNVPPEMPAEKLLDVFSGFGEIEEGMFDRQTRKLRGSALLVYKTAEAARAATVEPMKSIDGFELFCKMAIDEKKSDNESEGGKMSGLGGPMPGNQDGGPANQFEFSAGGGGGVQSPPHHHFNSPPLSLMGPEQPLLGSVALDRSGSGGGSGPYGPPSRFSGRDAGGPVGPGSFGAMGTGSPSRGPGMMGSVGSCAYLDGGSDSYSVGSIGRKGMQMGSPPGHRMSPGGGMC